MRYCFICHREKIEKLIKYSTGQFFNINYHYHNSCVEGVINNPKNFDNEIVQRCVDICNEPQRLRLIKECKKIQEKLK